MNNIPPEAQELMRKFLEEEALKKAEVAKNKSKTKDRKFLESLTTKKVFTPGELTDHARKQGWKLKRTTGSHQQFVNESGELITIPAVSGPQGTIEKNVALRILKKIFPDNY